MSRKTCRVFSITHAVGPGGVVLQVVGDLDGAALGVDAEIVGGGVVPDDGVAHRVKRLLNTSEVQLSKSFVDTMDGKCIPCT